MRLLVVLIILSGSLVLSVCTVIEKSVFNSEVRRRIEVNSTQLSPKTMDVTTTSIWKVTYSKTDKQLTHIRQLPLLVNIFMENIKQQFIPIFFNLPRLDTLSLDRNELYFVTKDRFSTIPVVYIFLRFNKIVQIEDGSFGMKVKHVYLACNNLQTLRKEWFVNPALLNVLDVDENNIEYIEEDTFKDFKTLEYFYIVHNGLKSIGDGAFSGSSYISEFSVGYNYLFELQPEIFKDSNITMDLLDISFNKLTFLHKDFIDKIHLTDSPKIDGNPWQCSCYYHHIIRWVPWNTYEGHKDREGEPRCVTDIGPFSTRCRTTVNKELIEVFTQASSEPPEKKGDSCIPIKTKVET